MAVFLFLIVVFKNEIRCSSVLDALSLCAATGWMSHFSASYMHHRTNVISSAKYISAANSIYMHNIIDIFKGNFIPLIDIIKSAKSL